MKKLRVVLLCGGKSAESEVSVVSAKLVWDSLDKTRYAARAVFIDQAGRWLALDPKRLTGRIRDAKAAPRGARPVDKDKLLAKAGVVFPVLHGTLGEDGAIQGLLEVAGAPYVGCGVLGSALGMDKEHAKRLAADAGVPVLPSATLHDPAEAPAAARKLGYPLFAKPARLGSSVGVSKITSARDLGPALREAFRYDDKILLEKGIDAREIECAVLGDPWARRGDPLELKASVCGEITPNAEFYTYESKYLDPDGARLDIPARLPRATAERARLLALQAFRALDAYGMGRMDFLLDKKTGKLWFNEINTIPGFTAASMYPLLWKASGLPPAELVDRLISLALRRARARARLKTTP